MSVTLANTFSRGTVPSIKNLELLLDTLGLTLSQFFANDEELTLLSQSEKELIENFRRLPPNIKNQCKKL